MSTGELILLGASCLLGLAIAVAVLEWRDRRERKEREMIAYLDEAIRAESEVLR